MRKINTDERAEFAWSSPKGKFAGSGKQVSEALGRQPLSTDLKERHPFDVEICRIAPGKSPYPYHSHSAQWEFYHVISGRGSVRHKEGTSPIEAGDAFIFPPGEPHQLIKIVQTTSSSTSSRTTLLASPASIQIVGNGWCARPSAG